MSADSIFHLATIEHCYVKMAFILFTYLKWASTWTVKPTLSKLHWRSKSVLLRQVIHQSRLCVMQSRLSSQSCDKHLLHSIPRAVRDKLHHFKRWSLKTGSATYYFILQMCHLQPFAIVAFNRYTYSFIATFILLCKSKNSSWGIILWYIA